MIEKLETFRATLEAAQRQRIVDDGMDPEIHMWRVRIVMGRKYAKIDTSDRQWGGAYMVDLATGEIFGVKAYGVIHRGHAYGTLDTLADWDWRGFKARKRITA